jgi:hypothetical protein
MDKFIYHATTVLMIVLFIFLAVYVLWCIKQFFGWIKDEIDIWKLKRSKR